MLPVFDDSVYLPEEAAALILKDSVFPSLNPSMLYRNKLKTKKLMIEGKEYRAYYKYDSNRHCFIYLCLETATPVMFYVQDGQLFINYGLGYQPFAVSQFEEVG
jgi:hypothetical protein